jgi:hypothetical protein
MKSSVSIQIPTSQFLEVVDFLREQGTDLDPVDAISEAISKWLDSVRVNPDLLWEDNTEVKGYMWKSKDTHLFLPNETDIRMRYKDRYHYAKVVGDEIIYQGRAFSPSSLVNAITNTSRNAWHDLWVKKPEMNDWLLADLARAKTLPLPKRR